MARHQRTMDREVLWRALSTSGVHVEPGLSEAELDALETEHGFTFPPDYGLLLSLGLPLEKAGRGRALLDWRNEPDEVARLVDWPVSGILPHVERHGFWRAAWGVRPRTDAEALRVARELLSSAPKLVPLSRYDFIASEPDLPGNPVFSVYETDIVHCGYELLHWIANRWGTHSSRGSLTGRPRKVEVWSDLATC